MRTFTFAFITVVLLFLTPANATSTRKLYGAQIINTGTLTLPTSTDTLTGRATTDALTNKDFDGGTASNTSRLTLPKAATATLSGLTRKQGTIAYDTTLNAMFFDDGSALNQLSTANIVYIRAHHSISDCSFARAASGFADVPIDASCTYTTDGSANATSITSDNDGTLNNNLPGVKFTLSAAKTVFACASFVASSSTNDCGFRLLLNATQLSDVVTRTAANPTGFTICGVAAASSGANKIKIQMNAPTGTCTMIAGGASTDIYWNIVGM